MSSKSKIDLYLSLAAQGLLAMNRSPLLNPTVKPASNVNPMTKAVGKKRSKKKRKRKTQRQSRRVNRRKKK